MIIDALVIKINPTKDNDAMVKVLTNERALSFFARGILKIDSKNAGALNLFNYSKINLTEGKQGGLTLKDAKSNKNFYHIMDGYDKTVALNYFSELLSKMLIDEEVCNFFDIALKVIEKLDEGFDTLTLVNIFTAKLLVELGVGPNVDECIVCHSKKNIIKMDFNNGGFVCKKCFNNLTKQTPLDLLKIYRYIFKVDSNNIGSYQIDKEYNKIIFRNLTDYIEENLNTKLNTKDLIKLI